MYDKSAGISFIVHVKFAAGLESSDEQFPLNISPGRYLRSTPIRFGLFAGISVN